MAENLRDIIHFHGATRIWGSIETTTSVDDRKYDFAMCIESAVSLCRVAWRKAHRRCISEERLHSRKERDKKKTKSIFSIYYIKFYWLLWIKSGNRIWCEHVQCVWLLLIKKWCNLNLITFENLHWLPHQLYFQAPNYLHSCYSTRLWTVCELPAKIEKKNKSRY